MSDQEIAAIDLLALVYGESIGVDLLEECFVSPTMEAHRTDILVDLIGAIKDRREEIRANSDT